MILSRGDTSIERPMTKKDGKLFKTNTGDVLEGCPLTFYLKDPNVKPYEKVVDDDEARACPRLTRRDEGSQDRR